MQLMCVSGALVKTSVATRRLAARRAYTATEEEEANIASMGMQRARHTSLTSRMPSMEGDYQLRDARVIQGPKSRLLPDAKVAKVAKEHHTDGMGVH
jgi:hypothetical protein